MITPLYAGLFGLMHCALICYVVFGRWRYQVSLGDGGEKMLRRRIRAHGNFIENVPIALILLFLVEKQGLGTIWLHSAGGLLLLGRLLHVLGLAQKRSANRTRQVAMVLTMSVITGLSIAAMILFAAAERSP